MATQTSAMQTWNDIHFTARDGLRLYARHYPAAGIDTPARSFASPA